MHWEDADLGEADVYKEGGRRGSKRRKILDILAVYLSFFMLSHPKETRGTKLVKIQLKTGIIEKFIASIPKPLLNVLTSWSRHNVWWKWHYWLWRWGSYPRCSQDTGHTSWFCRIRPSKFMYLSRLIWDLYFPLSTSSILKLHLVLYFRKPLLYSTLYANEGAKYLISNTRKYCLTATLTRARFELSTTLAMFIRGSSRP